MRKVIYGGATSLDLFLAREDGAVDWLIHNSEAMKIMQEMWPRFDAMVMGRKTFDSLGKPLTGRKNIVITRQPGWKADGAVGVKSIEDALFLAKEADANEVMVIGGGEIYNSLFGKAGRIYMTRVDAEPEADTFFPEINPKEWRLVSEKKHDADEKNKFAHTFQTWERFE